MLHALLQFKPTLILVSTKVRAAIQLHELQLKALNGRDVTPPPQDAPSLQTPTTSNGIPQLSAFPALSYC